MIRFARYIFVIVPFGGPSIAWAEVMDKEPSLAFLWSIATASAIVAVVAGRISPWFALLSVPLPLVYGLAVLFEFIDPYVGLAIAREGGVSYIVGVLGPRFWLSPGTWWAECSGGENAQPGARADAPQAARLSADALDRQCHILAVLHWREQ